MKRLLKQMMTSKTFQQSSKYRVELNDPENKLWGRGPSYRLDAEVLRDLALWSGGLLNRKLGGEGVKPYQPPECGKPYPIQPVIRKITFLTKMTVFTVEACTFIGKEHLLTQ